MIKKLNFCALALVILLLVACRSDSDSDTNTSNIAESEMWRVELHSYETAESLSATIAAVQYGGGVLETESEVVADRGNTFLLLGLTIEKIGEGRGSFSWDDAHVSDSDGNIFYRHPNDTFLAHLSIPRMRGTDIVFGKESGYVCFEIPLGTEGLSFVADGGDIILGIN